MPCRSDYMEPTATEHAATNKWNKAMKALADDITFSSDVLREFILSGEAVPATFQHVNRQYTDRVANFSQQFSKLYVKGDSGLLEHARELAANYDWLNAQLITGKHQPKEVTKKVEKQQIAHRKADLKRLMASLGAKGDAARLRKVLDADPTKPLDDQLGFSPDAF